MYNCVFFSKFNYIFVNDSNNDAFNVNDLNSNTTQEHLAQMIQN